MVRVKNVPSKENDMRKADFVQSAEGNQRRQPRSRSDSSLSSRKASDATLSSFSGSQSSIQADLRNVTIARKELKQIISALKQELHLRPSEILYSIEDSPPIYLTFLLAIQVIAFLCVHCLSAVRLLYKSIKMPQNFGTTYGFIN